MLDGNICDVQASYDCVTKTMPVTIEQPVENILWLPIGLKRIGDEAFAGADAYDHAVLPNADVEIGENAFDHSVGVYVK